FRDEENEQVLEQVARALKPGGRFLLETQHRDFLLRHMVPYSVIERGDDFLIDAHSFDPARGRFYTRRTVIRGGTVRRARVFLRLCTAPGMARPPGRRGRGGAGF